MYMYGVIFVRVAIIRAITIQYNGTSSPIYIRLPVATKGASDASRCSPSAGVCGIIVRRFPVNNTATCGRNRGAWASHWGRVLYNLYTKKIWMNRQYRIAIPREPTVGRHWWRSDNIICGASCVLLRIGRDFVNVPIMYIGVSSRVVGHRYFPGISAFSSRYGRTVGGHWRRSDIICGAVTDRPWFSIYIMYIKVIGDRYFAILYYYRTFA